MGSIISWIFSLRWLPTFYAVYLSKKLDLCPVEFPVFWIWLICVTVMGFSVIFCIWQLFWGKSLDLGFSGITSSGDFDFLMLAVTSKRWHCIAWRRLLWWLSPCWAVNYLLVMVSGRSYHCSSLVFRFSISNKSAKRYFKSILCFVFLPLRLLPLGLTIH